MSLEVSPSHKNRFLRNALVLQPDDHSHGLMLYFFMIIRTTDDIVIYVHTPWIANGTFFVVPGARSLASPNKKKWTDRWHGSLHYCSGRQRAASRYQEHFWAVITNHEAMMAWYTFGRYRLFNTQTVRPLCVVFRCFTFVYISGESGSLPYSYATAALSPPL